MDVRRSAQCGGLNAQGVLDAVSAIRKPFNDSVKTTQGRVKIPSGSSRHCCTVEPYKVSDDIWLAMDASMIVILFAVMGTE